MTYTDTTTTESRFSLATLEAAVGLAPEAEGLERYRGAESLFARRRYREAARELEAMLADAPDYGLAEARLLLARSYYHAAWLVKAEQAARALVDADPTDAYALALLGRCLERQSKHDEAAGFLAQARVFGVEI